MTIRRLLIALWCGGVAAAIAWGWHAYQLTKPSMYHHVDEAVLYLLLVLTFPSGLAVAAGLSLIFLALHKAAGIEVPGGPVSMTITSLLIAAVGYIQWFQWLPRAWRWSSQWRSGASAVNDGAVEQGDEPDERAI